MLIAVVLAVLVLAQWFPETPVGGALRRLLIDEPARRLDELKRGHVLLAFAVFIALAAAWVIGRDEAMQMAGRATAETLFNTMGIGFDLAAWFDVTATALVVAATVRFREAIGLAVAQARQWAKHCAGRLVNIFTSLARGRARRARPTPRPRHGEDPDGPDPGFAWA